MTRPPPILLGAFAFGAGLATGLARFPAPAFVILVLLGFALVVRRMWWAGALPVLAIGIIVGLRASAASAGWCAASLPLGEHRYSLRSVDPAEGTGRVHVAGWRCSGAITARWPRSAQLPAGASMRVTARWVPAARPLGRPDGTLMISAVDSVRVSATPIERARTALVRSARALFGTRAPLVDALVGGWRGELDPDLRTAFASSGLMHLLAISGLHLLCLAGWVVLALRLLRVPRHAAEALAAFSTLGYAAFLGWPAAATRTAVLLLVMACCRWRQRAVRRSAVLGITLVAMLAANPWAVADVGAWLSVLGWSGVLLATRWSDRAIGTAWWIRSLSASTGALIATAPVAALAFGQVAPIAVILNLVGAPLVVATLPALLAALVLYHVVPGIAAGLAASGNVMLWLLQLLVRVGSRVPGSASTGVTGWSAALPWLVVLAAAVWMLHGRPTWREAVRRGCWVALTALCVTAFGRPQGIVPDDRTLALLFLDVGQGDAALIRTPRGHWIEVDAGPIGEGYDAGRRVVVPLLARQGASRVDVFVLSHAHRDHVGGAAAVVERVPIGVAIEPGELFADSAYDTWLDALHAHHDRWRAARAGTTWSLDGVRFDVLHPPSPWPRQGEDLNEDSIVLEVEFGEFKALLMGDAGFVAESALAGHLPRVNVLKVGHHGSRTATGAAFLRAVDPQAAIVSVGRNRYGHPAPETLDRLTQAGVEVWRTDHEGTVTVLTDGRTFSVRGARAVAAFGTSR